jgi:aerobic carbon-monoxide dehydrogenase small subunit
MSMEISRFLVNGMPYEFVIEPRLTLLELLRDHIGLTGTKYCCGVGECGACTVLLNGKPILSCCTLAVAARDQEIITIEGLSQAGVLHPIQKAFVEYGAIQCGFCSPGMILTAKALLDENPNPSREEVKEAIAGNLCRCTGYVKIVDAILAAAKTMPTGAGLPDKK